MGVGPPALPGGVGTSRLGAPWSAPVYMGRGSPSRRPMKRPVMFRLFGTLARALGLQLTRVYRQMALALMG